MNRDSRELEPGVVTAGEDDTARAGAARRVLRSAAGLGVLLLVGPLAAALIVFGCGGERDTQSVAAGDGTPDLIVSSAGPAPAGGSALPAVQLGTGGEDSDAEAADALIPDLTVSVGDTLVAPGQAVEIVAHGTEDVDQVVLYDGLRDRRALAFDPATGSWKGMYRVPLQPKSPRLALSLTASNDAGRWRRVWVFLGVAAGGTAAVTPAAPAVQPERP
jgi:hypothetical protein